MKRDKIIAQLQSELVQATAAIADGAYYYSELQGPEFFDGYWRGRIFGLQQALTLLTGKELDYG
jgi:hypothetical protein